MTWASPALHRTIRAVLIAFAALMTVEFLAFATGWFAPITFVMIDAGNSTPLAALSWGLLGGHFYPPRRPLSSVHSLTWGYQPLLDTVKVGAILFFVGAAALVAYTLYVPAAAMLGGYDVGALFFPSSDRRRA